MKTKGGNKTAEIAQALRKSNVKTAWWSVINYFRGVLNMLRNVGLSIVLAHC